jgi:hypothetical protein
MAELRNKMLSIRLTPEQASYIEAAMDVLGEKRDSGARMVTKTETVMILLHLGMGAFNLKYGNPAKRMKKKKSS